MAEACPEITYDRLAWFSDWYIREDTYSKALVEIINFQHRHPFSVHWGDGKTSSSDGKRFKAGSQAAFHSRVNARYGPEPGITFYTHISDQYEPFCTIRIIWDLPIMYLRCVIFLDFDSLQEFVI